MPWAYYLVFAGEIEENHERDQLVSTLCNMAKIITGFLSSVILECYRYTSLLRVPGRRLYRADLYGFRTPSRGR